VPTPAAATAPPADAPATRAPAAPRSPDLAPTAPQVAALPKSATPPPPEVPGALSMRTARRALPTETAPAPEQTPFFAGVSNRDLIARLPTPEVDVRDPLELAPIPAVPGPRPERSTSELAPNGGAGTIKRDLVFEGKVDRDGRVHIEDKPSIGWAALPRPPSRKQIGDGLEAWGKDPYGTSPGSSNRAEKPGAPDDDSAEGSDIVTVATGSFDVSDQLMKMAGIDPYQARKQRFFDRTRDERAGMRATAELENLHDAINALDGNLKRVWADTRYSAAERRAVLFALWDECAEPRPDSDGDDDALTAAGTKARALIIAFIRRKLPSGHPDAFTAAELTDLNKKRQSRARFEPY
jgi:hypothetical protein